MHAVALNTANSQQEDVCFWGQWVDFQRWWLPMAPGHLEAPQKLGS